MTIPGNAKAILEELFMSNKISITDIMNETGISIRSLRRIIAGQKPGPHTDLMLVYFYCSKKLDGTLLQVFNEKEINVA